MLDQAAQEISEVIQAGLQATTKRTTRRACGYCWWNKDCKLVASQWQQARKRLRAAFAAGLPGTREAILTAHCHKSFLHTTTQAKQNFYNNWIAEATKSKDLFKMARWSNSKGQLKTPPLANPDGSIAITNKDKSNLLQATHLPTDRSDLDIQLLAPTNHAATQWPSFTLREIGQAFLQTKNTAPGTDKTPPSAVKKAWPNIKELIYSLCSLCLKEGWHPAPFRKATLLAIEKPGKRDKASPRSYRLIALLSALGKGLERATARRLAWQTINQQILPSGYIGALLLRSATDLAALLAEDIRQAFTSKQVLSTVTFDVQGGFDTVLPNQLINRLIQQSWPPNLINWVRSFLSNRLASIQLDGIPGQKFPLTGSLPQGSPVSPILFMLYLQPLFAATKAPGTLKRRGYADDGRITAVSTNLEANCSILQQEFARIQQWCQEEHIPLDLKKTELMHFSRKQNLDNPGLQILPTTGGTNTASHGCTLAPVPISGSLRWLGVYFDRKLTFRHHVMKMAQRGRITAQGLQMLGGITKGAPAHVLRYATKACVLPILTFGAEAWWPPPNTQQQVRALARKLDLIQNIALRATLPVYKTTPTVVLHQAAGIPPVEQLLDTITRQSAIRSSQLDPKHPLQTRKTNAYKQRHPTYKDLRIRLLPAPITPSNPLIEAPWEHFPEKTVKFDQSPSENNWASSFAKWQSTKNQRALWLFTDGSKLKDGRTGAGWIAYCAGLLIALASRFSQDTRVKALI